MFGSLTSRKINMDSPSIGVRPPFLPSFHSSADLRKTPTAPPLGSAVFCRLLLHTQKYSQSRRNVKNRPIQRTIIYIRLKSLLSVNNRAQSGSSLPYTSGLPSSPDRNNADPAGSEYRARKQRRSPSQTGGYTPSSIQ